MVASAAPGFVGTARFRVVSKVGQGAGGVVYEALDRERNTRVALKTLSTVTPETLLLLKKEFRAVQDLQHANLVRLGELFEEDGRWFFTMELVRGGTILAYVRDEAVSVVRTASPGDAARVAEPVFHETRLRSALAQLVRGLSALHAAGKVHRDVKPSNVLVTPEGRVVTLDFGVVSDVARANRGRGVENLMGTVAYMSPEQAASEPVGPASDFYAVGVVMYEALTGRTPFSGSDQQVLEAKLAGEPPRPSDVAPDVPRELDALCVDLLRIEPSARPSGAEILARLQAPSGEDDPSVGARSGVFVGRRRELRLLDEALADTRKGNPVTVFVTGESGVGKSCVVRRFAEGLRAREPNAVVLEGRCYERESVPFKAIDDLFDDLTSFLLGLPRAELAEIVPKDAHLIGRVFPVLEQVGALARAAETDGERSGDAAEGAPAVEDVVPQQLRERVFAALRDLLYRVAHRRPLVLSIDDLQWTDADSLALLRALLHPPEAPPLLLVVTQRVGTDTMDARSGRPAIRLPGDTRTVAVDLLSPGDAEQLVQTLLGPNEAAKARDAVRAIAADAHGHPLFIDELVRQAMSGASGKGKAALRLDDALWERVVALEPTSRRFVELLAVAGVPITQELAAAAAAIDLGQLFEMVADLRSAKLVRTEGARRSDLVGPYHDRVRESVALHLDEETRKGWHGRIALAPESMKSTDHEMLAVHWQGAEQPDLAAKYAARAGDDAGRALAFDRAVRLYETALAQRPLEGAAGAELRLKLADALTNVGRDADAAAVRLDVARTATPIEAIDLRRIAAEQLLCSGHFDEGLQTLRSAIDAAGLRFPKTPLQALVLYVLYRVLLAFRGIAFRPRDEAAVDAHARLRVDCSWSAGSGLLMTDNVRGVYFQTANLIEALRYGDKARVLRALAFEALAAGGPDRKRSGGLLDVARRLAVEVDTPFGHAMVSAADGGLAYFWGEWERAHPRLVEAEALFRDRCVGSTFQLNSVRLMLYRVLTYRGRIRELEERVGPIARDAERRNDLYALVNIRTVALSLLGIARDEPEAVARDIELAMEQLSGRGFHVQHYLSLYGLGQVELYLGKGAEAHARMTSTWRAVKRAMLSRVAFIRIQSLEQLARAAIAASLVDRSRATTLLAEASGHATVLEREPAAWASALAKLLHAGIANASGDEAGARATLAAAIPVLEGLSMDLHATAARYQLGRARGIAGDGDVAVAEKWMRAQTIREPSKIAHMLIPGFARPPAP